MKVLIVSDSHNKCFYLERVLEKVQPIDLMIHLGDFEGDERRIKELASCPIAMVSGNNDYFTEIPRDDFIELGQYYIMITHGHKYGVNYGVDQIKEIAMLNGANIVMFGHTHRPMIDLTEDTIWAINPGSISLPRQNGKKPSFIIMDIDSRGDAHFTINYVDEND